MKPIGIEIRSGIVPGPGSILHRLIAMLGLLVLAGCSTPPVARQPVSPEQFVKERLGFIVDGQLTREDVLVQLGAASATYEGDRILAYQLVVNKVGRWYIRSPALDFEPGTRDLSVPSCSLILVFDEHGILERHSLVLPATLTQFNWQPSAEGSPGP